MRDLLRILSWVCLGLSALTMMFSCGRYGRDVQLALKYAGDNRGELEAVLEHYSQNKSDSLKLKAAIYLIGNMTWHKSYPAELYGQFCREVDSLFLCREDNDLTNEKLRAISDKYVSDMIPVPDVRIATADYLIWNIDYSFWQWHSSPFLQHLDFDRFCEYVLPYKCLDFQPMTRWKEEYSNVKRGELDSYAQFSDMHDNARMAVYASQNAMRDSLIVSWKTMDSQIPLLDIIPLMHMPYGTCVEHSVLGVLNARSKGLPVSLDFVPSWPNADGVHHWNNILVSRRRNIDYEPFETTPGAIHYIDSPLAKVYRYKFSPDRMFLDVMKKEGVLHGRLNNLFLQDVTKEYCKTAEVTIHLNKEAGKSNFVYLCVYTNNGWTPVALSRKKGRKVVFQDVGVGCVYLPVVYLGEVQMAVESPFLLNTLGQKENLVADTVKRQEIRLKRKSGSSGNIFKIRHLLRGGMIEVSDYNDFRNSQVVAELPACQYMAGEESVTDTSSHRYWRLTGSHKGRSDFAELYFYERGTGKRLSGRLVTSGADVRNPKYDTAEHICDGDALTNFTVEGSERWVGFDFGHPVSVGEVGYIRRGDGNDINDFSSIRFMRMFLDSPYVVHLSWAAL